MNLEEWLYGIDRITENIKYLNNLNVLDVSFHSGHSLELYVAIKDEEHIRGLSNLEDITLDGMLFVYDKPTYLPFTAKDMLFDMDIAWFDENGRIIDSRFIPAGQKELVTVQQQYSFAIETKAGMLPQSSIVLPGKG